MMKFLNRYKTIIAISGIIIILVLIRTFSRDHFENNAKTLAKPSFNHSIIISEKQISTIHGDILIVKLDKNGLSLKELPGEAITVPVDSVLSKENVRKIFKHDGPVLIVSSDPALSSRIWMVLSQMGRRDIFILADNPDNEVFNNKFQPETLSRPEL
jgi:hypothetical protein